MSLLDKPRLFFFHNDERRWRRLKPLRYSLALSKQCDAYARQMRDKNMLIHDDDLSNHIWQVLPAMISCGENIGVTSPPGAQKRLQEAFMQSPGHKANILGNFNRVGIGLFHDKKSNLVWCCVRFAKV